MTVDSEATPLVSIVVPVFNGQRFLRESLNSIVAQSYRNREILVLDDASTDSTPEILASYGNAIRPIRNEANLGQFKTVNRGIGLASGEFIAVYHADDVYDPEIVKREVSALLNWPQVGAVFAKDIFIDEHGTEYHRLQLPDGISTNEPMDYAQVLNGLLTYKNRFFRCPSSMVRRSVYRSVGGYEPDSYFSASDMEMFVRIARGHDVLILDEYLFRYRHTSGQESTTYNRLRTTQELHFKILDRYLAEGGRSLASANSLAAHEAHREEDRIMRSIALYVQDRIPDARQLLGELKIARLLGSARVQRFRLFVLYAMMQALARMKRRSGIAEYFRKRWHSK